MTPVLLLALLLPPASQAQIPTVAPPVQSSQSVSSNPSALALDVLGPQNPFLGGIPSEKPTPGVLPLSLLDAIDRGLKHNLGLFLSSEGTESARGARYRAYSELLPNLTSHITETSQQINLAALGFTHFPGVPQILGPFQVFDARAALSQRVFDYTSLNRARASNQDIAASRFSYRNARDLVVLVVGANYLQAIADASRIEAVQAQFNTAKTLHQQAVDMKNVGMLAGIDVLRAQVEMQVQQQRLIVAQNDFEKQKLSLARAIGLPVGQQFALSDTIPYAPAPPLTLEEALADAYRNRGDYLSAQSAVRSAEFNKKAAFGEALPSISFNADYGTIGNTPTSTHETYTATAGLQIPIFQGGKVHGDVLLAESQLRQRKAELDDLRSRIEFDVRLAFLDLKAASDQLEVARSSLDVARQELTQAQDRFAAGVANNIEVVTAQESLATANENYISSLYAHNIAKLLLARAVGVAEEATKKYLKGQQP